MIVIQQKHRDIEIVYAIRYTAWLRADKYTVLRKSDQLALALENLKRAGYTPEDIQAIERHAKRQLIPVHQAVIDEVDDGGK